MSEAVRPKWLYRLESRTPDKGLWYNGHGEYTFDLGKVPNCASRDLDMSLDARYSRHGRKWWSSCSNLGDLTHWFSVENAKHLESNGFVFTKYLASDYMEFDKETLFLKETAQQRIELPLSEVFK